MALDREPFGGLITGDAQIEMNNLLMGGEDGVYVVKDFNPWQMPKVRSSDESAGNIRGTISGKEILGGRPVSARILVTQGNQAAATSAVDNLMAAFHPTEFDQWFAFQLGGVKQGFYGRPRQAAVKGAKYLGRGLVDMEVRFLASDPYRYSSDVVLRNSQVESSTGGADFTSAAYLEFPISFGDTVNGLFDALNEGTVSAPWQAVVTGPLTGPVITNVSTGQHMAFPSLMVNEGQQLVIDSRWHTALLGGATSIGFLSAGSSWFDLAPDINTIRFSSADETDTGSLSMTWRSAWL